MKNLEEYIEKAKSLENARPLITISELSAMLDARDAAPPPASGGAGSRAPGWRSFILPALSAVAVILAVLSSNREIESPNISRQNYTEKVNSNDFNGANSEFSIFTENGKSETGFEKNAARAPRQGDKITGSIKKVRGAQIASSESQSKSVPPESGIAQSESRRTETPQSQFNPDSFRAEQRNMMDSLLAARLSRIDSMLAMRQPSEPSRVDTLYIKEIIKQDPLKIDFRHSLSINFWLMKDNIYEVQWEYAPFERWSFTLKGGYGSLLGSDKVFRTNTGIEQKSPYDLIIIGSKVAYYLLGDFDHGVQAGLDATYYATSYNVARAAGPYEEGRGLNLVPFVGYKVILSPGYTLNAQAGYGMKYHNKFEGFRDGSGVYQGYIRSIIKPTYVFNVNFGWSL